MNGQTPKLSLIAMFYVVVFASAFTVAGVLHSQRDRFPDVAEKAKTLVFSSSDSTGSSTVIVVTEDGNAGEVSDKSSRRESSFLGSVNFTSALQWLLRLPTSMD